MIEFGFVTMLAICIAVSVVISYFFGRRYQTFWPKFAIFLIASAIGFFMFPILCGAWTVAAPHEKELILAAIRGRIWQIIVAVTVMAYFGTWRLQAIIEDRGR
jgi:hypothetical protein